MNIKPSLESLISPFSKDEFLADNWPHKPLHIESNNPKHFVELMDIPQLISFNSFEASWCHEAFVLPAKNGDESLGFAVTGPAIKNLYARGMPMFVHKPERVFSNLNNWIKQLAIDLGLPAQTKIVCTTHASIGGTSTKTHFDQAASFILQLHGVKTWRIAPNKSTPDPTQRHSLTMPRLHGELASYMQEPLPNEMPEDYTTITLKPGSLLFLPSGWWHEVEAPAESFALMFVILGTTWADIFLSALRKKLIQSQEWRQLAVGARSRNDELREKARFKTDSMLGDFQKILDQLTLSDLVSPTYLKSSTVTLYFQENVAFFKSLDFESRIELGVDEKKVLMEIDKYPFEFSSLEISNLGYQPTKVEAVIAALLEVQFLVER